VISGIIYVIKHGPQWKDAPKAYGPYKTLYNRFVRWSLLGVFDRIFTALARKGAKTERIMIGATHLRAHRTAASLAQKAHKRRAELQTARRLRRGWPARAIAPYGGPSE